MDASVGKLKKGKFSKSCMSNFTTGEKIKISKNVKEAMVESLMREHTHKYVIPVEWSYRGEIYPHVYHPKLRKVTKLRCKCGEEIAR